VNGRVDWEGGLGRLGRVGAVGVLGHLYLLLLRWAGVHVLSISFMKA